MLNMSVKCSSPFFQNLKDFYLFSANSSKLGCFSTDFDHEFETFVIIENFKKCNLGIITQFGTLVSFDIIHD